MSAMLTPETQDLVDALVGATAIAKRARDWTLAASAAEPGESPDAADEAFLDVLLGVVALGTKLEAALDQWGSPADGDEPTPHDAPMPMRDLLR